MATPVKTDMPMTKNPLESPGIFLGHSAFV